MKKFSLRSHVRRAVATFALGLAVAGCQGGAPATTDTTARVTTLGTENIAIVAPGQMESGPTISGALAPENQATLRAEISGPVVSATADRGERVTRGQLLARLDDSEIEVMYLSAKSAHTATEFDASVAKREEDRAIKLAAAGAISQRELEQAKRVNAAAQAQLADAKSRMALAEKQRSATRIVAPFPGVISEKHVSAGDLVQPGNAIYTIMDPASMRLEASVPARELSDVKTGARVRFKVSGYGDKGFEGRVSRVSPAADPTTGQISVIVSIPNAGQALVAGLFAEGRIAAQSRSALLAPVTSVNLSGAAPSMMRVKGGRVEKVDVTVGQRDPATEMFEILTGVAAGDTVLLGSALGLLPGTVVRVGASGDAAAAPAPAPVQSSGSGGGAH